jgi:hypothetical protein
VGFCSDSDDDFGGGTAPPIVVRSSTSASFSDIITADATFILIIDFVVKVR